MEKKTLQDASILDKNAFLDLADSAARLGSNMPDMAAQRVELKRLEHERQRAIHRKNFEDSMRALEVKQAIEERELLSVPPSDPQHLPAFSAPTTPPRVPSVVNGHQTPTFEFDLAISSSKPTKRKSVTYAPTVSHSPDASAPYLSSLHPHSFARTPGAKSMPASRRTSASSEQLDELSELTLHALAINERQHPASAHPSTRSRTQDHLDLDSQYNAGSMLDDELDKEIHSAIMYLPSSSDDDHKFPVTRTDSYPGKLSASSAALDLAPLSQTPPRSSFMGRAAELSGKSSEWPQFSGRVPDAFPSRPERHRTVTTPIGTIRDNLATLSKLSGNVSSVPVSAAPTPSIPHLTPNGSRRSSPPSLSDSLASIMTARSVPATPLAGNPPNASSVTRADISALAGVKSPGTPLGHPAAGGGADHSATHTLADSRAFSTGDLTATLSRLAGVGSQFDGQYPQGGATEYDALYASSALSGAAFDSNSSGGGSRFSSYGSSSFEHGVGSRVPSGVTVGSAAGSGSTALYQHHGARYGLSVGSRIGGGQDKMNGLHGPKHKRGGDVDREFNRFAGTRLEDLQGEIPSLCKDQHGCRYLQKKLEEGIPEHRDLIFRETFTHFSDLMTDPFGNYLCQKLLEFSTDEQRNLICESVAHDLVTISLNMHGTRAVQKMIDFLSTPRQIHAMIVALSLHVVALIKDLNGNHVIQKCLNKLPPEDNQFIYNSVASNCVEVATHRHGCCVLQRCIDHASDSQRVQLVQEITYNALTLVQDPYGNYVVQYILDLNDNRFSDGVIRQFTGNVCALSVQKFSSNVIEKCIRVAEPTTRKILIEELINRNRLEKLLRDSFGNYCVQTALDYADPLQRAQLVEGIRPVLPLIRNTPYGKRIQSKLQREQLDGGLGHYGGGSAGYHGAPGQSSNGFGMHGHGLAHGHHSQPRHSSQQMHGADLYGSYSNGLSALAAQTPQMHSAQLHPGLAHNIDPYILQNAGLGQGLGSNHAAAFSTFNSGSFGPSVPITDTQYRQGFHYGI